jgi:hypothetical protein
LPRVFSELGQQLREEHAADFALIVTGQLAALNEPPPSTCTTSAAKRCSTPSATRKHAASNWNWAMRRSTSRCRCATTAPAFRMMC